MIAVLQIERVQNHSLYQQYAVNKLHMEASAGAGATTERILWHGTSEATVPQINVHGFNRSYCGKNGQNSNPWLINILNNQHRL